MSEVLSPPPPPSAEALDSLSPELRAWVEGLHIYIAKTVLVHNEVQNVSDTGGAGSGGSGNQYVGLKIEGTTYKVLHDGTI